jgi:hypothetical protein
MLPAIRELSDLIFEHAERFPDGDYKKALDLCAAINRTSTEPVVPSSDYGTIWGSAERVLRNETVQALRVLNESLELRLLNRNQRLSAEKLSHSLTKTQVSQLQKRIAEMGVPELREKPTACCFATLKDACKTDPSVLEKAHKSKCGCCRQNYIIGYGCQKFKSAGKLDHKLNGCTHSSRSCATCRRGDAMRPQYGI